MDVRSPFFQNIAAALAGVLFLNPIMVAAAEATLAAADANTGVTQAGNGVPVVNIATPNGNGLSHNRFSDYNVGQQGLILNNATAKTQGTQLGGIILGNANLKGQAANLILNEVTGGSPSQLRGYTEVAGQQAHVVVANPNGITCDGCGFINTPRATLTTGKPIVESGRLDRLQVEGGAISIEGQGLNADNIDQFDLITRSAKINAELHANRLNVITGANDVKVADLSVSKRVANKTDAPQLAIDSSVLGGMYAGAIRLVGTEAGVGVRLAGDLAASAGDIQIDASGKLSLAQTVATNDVRMAAESLELNGKVYAANSANAQVTGSLTNKQSLAAGARIDLKGETLDNQGLIEAGVNADNSRNANGDVALSGDSLRNTGTVAASRDLSASSRNTLNNQGGTLSGHRATNLSAATLDNRSSGRVLSAGELKVDVARLHNAQGTLASQGDFSATLSESLDNQGGTLSSQGALHVTAKQGAAGQLSQVALNNQGGRILANDAMGLAGQSLSNGNGGLISGKADLTVAVSQTVDNTAGTLVADGKLTLDAAELSNGANGQVAAKGDLAVGVGVLQQQGGQLLSQSALTLNASAVDNSQGGLIAANQGLDLSVTQSLNNSAGEVSTRGKAIVRMAQGTLNNSGAGKIIGDQGLALTVQRLLNGAKGMLIGRDSLTLIGGSLDNSVGGILSSRQALNIDLTGELDNHGQGQLLSEGSLTVGAASLNNSGSGVLSSAGKLEVKRGGLNNQGGKLLSDDQLTITNSSLDNRNGGTVSAKNALTLATGQLDNQKGRIVGDSTLSLSAAQVNNGDQGRIASQGAMQISANGLDQQNQGELVSQSALTLDLNHGTLNNSGNGLIATPGTLLLNNLGTVINRQGGEISSAQSFLFGAEALDNSAGRVISGQALELRVAKALQNVKGALSAGGPLKVAAASLDNSVAGVLASQDDLTLDLRGKLDNHQGGVISAAKALTLTSGELDNRDQGLLASDGALRLTTGTADNSQGGQIASQDRLEVNTADLNNRGGVVSSQQLLTLEAGNIDNRGGGLITSAAGLTLSAGSLDSSRLDANQGGGEVSAKETLSLTVARLIQRQGRLIGEAGVSLDLKGGDLDNRGGLLFAKGPLTLSNLNRLDNRDKGEVSSNQSYSLAAKAIDNGAQGSLLSAGSLVLDLGSGTLRNAGGGLVSGWQGLSVKAGQVDNSGKGTLSSRDGALTVELKGSERGLNNSGEGALVSQGPLTVIAKDLNNSSKGVLSSAGDLALTLDGELSNRDGGLVDSQGQLNLKAAGIDNHAGQIGSQQNSTVNAGSLDNGAGQLTSAAAVNLTLSGQLTNDQKAKLVSAGPLVLKADRLDNRGGSLIGQNVLDITANSLSNADGGTLAARNALILRLTGALDNSGDGLIHSQAGSLDLNAGSLANNGGTLHAQGDLTLALDGALSNQNGRLQSQAGNLDLKRSSGVDNSAGGVLSSVNGWLKLITAGLFDNDAGTTQAQSLDITAQGVDNRAGHLSALNGDTTITATGAAFNNQGGGLYAHQLLKVIAGDFDNQGAGPGQGGKVAAQRIDFGLSGALTNAHGILESDSTLSLQATSLNNQNGQLRALGSLGTTRITSAGLLDNRGGAIEAANNIFALDVADLKNTAGRLLHTGAGSFGVATGQIAQAGGSLITNGLLNITADSWSNSSVLQAGELVLNIGTFSQTASGQLLAARSLTGTGGNWSNDGLLASDGSLNLTLSGGYSGNGRLTSLGTLNLSAASLDLGSTASLAGGGHTSVTSTGLFTNRGRLTAADDLTLRAGTLNNSGTLGSAQKLSLYAPILLNDNGLIFSGGDMALRVGSFTNRYADVYSLAALDLAADDAGGRSALLENISATLESASDMSLAAASIINRKDFFSVSERLTSGTITYQCLNCKGSHFDLNYYVNEKIERTVTADSAASAISAGRNLDVSSESFTNQHSVVSAAGNIGITTGSFLNQGASTESVTRSRTFRNPVDSESSSVFRGLVSSSGAVAQYNKYNSLYVHRYIAPNGKEEDTYFSPQQQITNQPNPYFNPAAGYGVPAKILSYTLVSSSEISTNSGVAANAIVQAGGNVSINASSSLGNGVSRSNVAYSSGTSKVSDTSVGASTGGVVVHLNAQLPPDLAQQQLNPLTLPGFGIPSGPNGLFRLSGQTVQSSDASGVQSAAGDHTLSQRTVPLALRERALAGVDGQSSAVALDPVGSALAGRPSVDAVQGLPGNRISSRPHRYLIETNPELTNLKSFLGSDYLLDRLGYDPDQTQKRLGDGLYEQRLMREVIVARTGQRYLAGLTSDEAMFRYLMDNAVASKEALKLSLGVSLTAEQVAALTHDIVWMEEHEVMGEKVLVPVLYLAQAEGRLAANGALIQGQDVNLISGSELNNQGTLRASNNLVASARNISNIGLMEAGERLELLASDSIRNARGGIISGRDVGLTAERGDISNERTVSRHSASYGRKTWTNDYVDSAARIEAGNLLSLSAGRDIANIGSVLQSRGDIEFDAGRDINLAAATELHQVTKGKKYNDEHLRQIGGEVIAGNDIYASAGRDITATASSLSAGRDLDVMAARDVAIVSAANEDHFYSKSKKITKSTDKVNQVGSSVEAGRDVSINAGQDLTLLASKVKGGQDVDLDAERDLNVLSAKDEKASFYFKKSKGSFGRSKSVQKESYDSTNVASVVEAGRDLTLNTSKASDGGMSIDGGRDVTIIGSQLKAGGDLMVGATGDIAVLSGVEEHGSYSKKTKSGFLGLSSSGKSKMKTTASQVSSELEAGNDVVVAAGNDVRLRASTASAGNDVELRSGLVTETGDINLVAANDTAYSRSEKYKKKIGPSMSGGMISYASAQKSGQIAQSSTSVGSQVAAERDANLNAERDINIVGSGVSAGRNVMLGAGRDVNIVATSNSSTDKRWEQEQRVGMALGMQSSSRYTPEEERTYFGETHVASEQIVRRDTQAVAPSLVQSGDTLVVDAGRDIQVKGSQLLAGGDASLEAGRDIRVVSSTQSRVLTETDKTATLGGGIMKSPAKGPMNYGVMADGDYLDGTNRATSQVEVHSAISAEGDLSLKSGRDTEIAGGNLVADSVAIDAGRDIRIDSPVNKEILYRDVMQGGVGGGAGLRPHEENAYITSPSIQPSSIVATEGDISLNAGQDVTIQGATLLAQRDVVIEAVRDARLGGASVSFDNHNDVVSNSMASVDKTNTSFNSTASAPLEIQAGRDVLIQAGQDVVAKNLLVDAERDIDIIAGRDLTVAATQRERSTGSTSLGLKGDMFGLGEFARAFSEGQSGSEMLSAAAQANPLLNNINNIAKTDKNEDKWQNAAVLAYRLYSSNPSAGSGEATGSSSAASYGFDLSRGINGRLGYQRSQSEWNEQSGSELAAGRDLYLEAGRDLALMDGTQASAVRDAYLVGGRDIVVRSAENTSKERSSGGGVTVGYNGGWYGGLDVNGSRGDSAQYQNASVSAGKALITDSGRDTTIIGGNLHGGDVEMSVGRNLALISEQGTIDQQSASASFTAGSRFSVSASASERDRQAVDRPATITADDRLRIDVAQNTHLKGSQIDSGTGNLELVTETLTYEDLKNHDRASQGSASYSGSSDANTWGNGGEAQEGGGFNAGMPIANLEGGDTRAAIGEGAIRNHAGEELDTGISRDVAGAHEETDSAEISQYSAKSELLGIAAQEGYNAIGDYAQKQMLEAEVNALNAEKQGDTAKAAYWREQGKKWEEGSLNRTFAHVVMGMLLSEASGQGALAGGAAAGANQVLNGLIYDSLKAQGVVDQGNRAQQDRVQEITAIFLGALAGNATGSGAGLTGGAVALNADKFNRQLHPNEIQWINENAGEYARLTKISEEEAKSQLAQQALRDVDLLWGALLGGDDDSSARAYLAKASGTFVNQLNEEQKLFTVVGNQNRRPEQFAQETDRDFYKQYVAPGVNRGAVAGLAAQMGEGALENAAAIASHPLGPKGYAAETIALGLWQTITNPFDWFLETGETLGEGNASAWNEESLKQLSEIYGQDVATLHQLMVLTNDLVVAAEVVGVGRAGGSTTKRVQDLIDRKNRQQDANQVLDPSSPGTGEGAEAPLNSRGVIVAGKGESNPILALPPGRKGSVIREALEDHEYEQALDIVKLKGGEFKGAPAGSFPGIDGWLDGVPVQLKRIEGSGINAVRRNIVKGAGNMQKAGYRGDLYVDASKTGVSMKEMLGHFNSGSPVAKIPNEGSVQNIYIKTQDGWLNITRGRIASGGI